MSVMAALLDIYARQVSVRRGYAARGMQPKFEKRSGVDHSTISNWRRTRNARLDNFEAVANALGYRLVLEKINERHDDHLPVSEQQA